MPIRDEPSRKFVEASDADEDAPLEMIKRMELDDQEASNDPGEERERDPESAQKDIDPRLLQGADVQRVRKGFRLSSVCWD